MEPFSPPFNKIIKGNGSLPLCGEIIPRKFLPQEDPFGHEFVIFSSAFIGFYCWGVFLDWIVYFMLYFVVPFCFVNCLGIVYWP